MILVSRKCVQSLYFPHISINISKASRDIFFLSKEMVKYYLRTWSINFNSSPNNYSMYETQRHLPGEVLLLRD